MKNILLLFLSDVKIDKNEQGKIAETAYDNIEGEKTKTTSESAVRYLLKKFPLDKIFIFASKRVRKNIAGYLGEDGKPRTHLAFSTERIKEFLPRVDDEFFDTLDFDEDESGNENLKSVAEMAGRIQKFVAQCADEKVTLHVDLTGGMRHVNMMMLELTRLLEYSGLKVENVLYSNYKGSEKPGTIEEVQNVYELFQLIAGVEEFVNFGSVKALEFYYKDKREKLSAPLTKLLDSMKNFAEAIKLCHYGQFRESIKNLHDAVHDFDKHSSTDMEDILMARLIDPISKNYHDLISIRDKDDLRIIRWCLDNDYLQQALTLYTERIPEYLGEKGIITQTETEAKKLAELAKKEEVKLNPCFYLFSNAKPKEHPLEDGKQIFCKAIKSAAKTVVTKDQTFDFDEWLTALNKELEPLKLHCDDKTDFRTQFETLVELFENPQPLKDLSSPELNPIRKIIDNLPEEIALEFKSAKWGGARYKILTRFFINVLTDNDVPKYFIGSNFMKYPKSIKIHELLNEGTFSIQIPKEKFLSIVDLYFRIKDERNHSNHAREDYGEFKTAEKLHKAMNDGLDEIQAALKEIKL